MRAAVDCRDRRALAALCKLLCRERGSLPSLLRVLAGAAGSTVGRLSSALGLGEHTVRRLLRRLELLGLAYRVRERGVDRWYPAGPVSELCLELGEEPEAGSRVEALLDVVESTWGPVSPERWSISWVLRPDGLLEYRLVRRIVKVGAAPPALRYATVVGSGDEYRVRLVVQGEEVEPELQLYKGVYGGLSLVHAVIPSDLVRRAWSGLGPGDTLTVEVADSKRLYVCKLGAGAFRACFPLQPLPSVYKLTARFRLSNRSLVLMGKGVVHGGSERPRPDLPEAEVSEAEGWDLEVTLRASRGPLPWLYVYFDLRPRYPSAVRGWVVLEGLGPSECRLCTGCPGEVF